MAKHYNITGTLHDRADTIGDLLGDAAEGLEVFDEEEPDMSVIELAIERLYDLQEAMRVLKDDVSKADDDVRQVKVMVEELSGRLF